MMEKKQIKHKSSPGEAKALIEILHQRINGKVVNKIGSLILHLSQKCNSNCLHCVNIKRSQEIDEEIVKKLASLTPISICVAGGGEPTVLSDSTKFARLLTQFPDKSIFLITNGIIIPPRHNDWAKKVGFLRVSLDAANMATYSKIKLINCFNRVLGNITHYLSGDIPKIEISFVVQKMNILEIPEFILLFMPLYYQYGKKLSLRFREVLNQLALVPSEADFSLMRRRLEVLNHSSPLLRHFIAEASDYHQMKSKPSLCEQAIPIFPRCLSALIQCMVDPWGNVYPCGKRGKFKHHFVGNLLQDSWAKIQDRQYEFFCSTDPSQSVECRGCWNILTNEILEESLTNKFIHLPFIREFPTLYTRWE